MDKGVTARGAVGVGLKSTVSVGLIYLLYRTIDVGASWTLIGRLTPGVAVAAALLLAVTTVVTGGRWWLVMRLLGRPISLPDAIRLMFTGNFFSQVLPTSFGGDAVRVWYLRRRGVPYQPAISGVLLERATGFFGLAVLVAAGMLALGARIDLPAVRYGLLAALPLTAGALAGIGMADRLPTVRRATVLRPIVALADDTRRVMLAGWPFLTLLALSLAGHVAGALSVWVLAAGLGAQLSPAAALALVPAVFLITLFPVSMAGWGVREGAMVLMLSFAGVGAGAALALSVLFGGLMLVAASPGLALWLARRARPLAESA